MRGDWKSALGLAITVGLVAACATNPQPTNATQEVQSTGEFERDREAILAMAGTFEVTFDFIETASLNADYTTKDRKLSGAYEVVRVVEDRGDTISLQHILYVGGEDRFPLKHWRQDWKYEPSRVLTFLGGNAWTSKTVSAEAREGAWSQEVYQVDDSPRYGAVGQWTYDNNIASWQPAQAWRPLPRRDMTTRDDYHVVDAVNRHTITPNGWVHEQENTKVVLTSGEPEALVREIAVNTYKRTNAFDPAEVDAHWKATARFWAEVREVWEDLEASQQPFSVTQKGETESLYNPLLGLAAAVEEGQMSVNEASAEARQVIAEFTTKDLPPLVERLR